MGRTLGSLLRSTSSGIQLSGGASTMREYDDDEIELQWAVIERLPTYKRTRFSLLETVEGEDRGGDGNGKGMRVIDVTKLRALERTGFIGKLIRHIQDDNLQLLEKQRERIDRVGVQLPKVEVKFKNLCVEMACEVVDGKPLPTLWNTITSWIFGLAKLSGVTYKEAKISIIKDASGIIKPSRLTLLLGPPGCGKTTLLLALSGKLNPSLKATGEISYNGYRLGEFVPQKTSAYISQHDLHIPEITVRETLDFSARCQGVGSRAEIMKEVSRREKLEGIVPEPDIDTYMKATSVKGLARSLQTDYILKILGLDICADTMVGDAMRRGISGGQKKRLTTGEMIVGPTKALFMDEISTGLDSSTTFQIIECLRQLVHITDATALISLLQPAPETYELFDDIILMGEGKIVYHGPRSGIVQFFEDCGFRCPQRKGTADFLQEVMSRKDQEQYWYHTDRPYSYVTVDEFCERFKASQVGQRMHEEILKSFDKSKCHKDALFFSVYSLSKWQLFKACMTREWLLMKRNSFVYIFKSFQLIIVATITMTTFLRTRMSVDLEHANYYMGALFYAILVLMFDGFPELSMTVARLPVFYKQRDLYFYPAWAYAIPASTLKIPISLVQATVWTSLTYYVIGYSPEAARFFRHILLLFAVHQMATSLFRFMASIFRTIVASTMGGSVALMMILLFGGFILPQPSMPAWLKWGFWASPWTYCEIGISVNEFLSPRWQQSTPGKTTFGIQTLTSRGLNFGDHFYWISVGALLGFTILFNIGFTIALTFLKSPGRARAILSRDKLSEIKGKQDKKVDTCLQKKPNPYASNTASENRNAERVVMPFQPLPIAFQDVQYYVDTPQEMRAQGFPEKRLQLLQDITGAFRPGILTALMGVSGAGKTTFLDVLSGRKTGGTIEGLITIGGYPKVQETFARISGYCEQTDIHSPQITVEESILYSAWLRLSPQIDKKTKAEFVKEVLGTIELHTIKDMLVGIPGVNGLSTEQRKRLTIAVELVANPSLIFMDEPTSGLDARAAAIVMRAVRNVVDTGRTVVCTIHQPSIDIFEAFDELFLMKRGGQIIYSGPLGRHSSRVIEYFERIPGIPKIKNNYNPATWMLEVTSTSIEDQLGVDFAKIYRDSSLYKDNKEMTKQLSTPPRGSEDLRFPTRFPQNDWEQFKACLWKQHLSYWRSPSYNLVRILFMIATSVGLAVLFWKRGTNIQNQQDLFTVFGSIYTAVILLGIFNCLAVMPFISIERTVLYREMFAGMYSSSAYSLAQVVIELPYTFLQALLFTVITYPSMGYYRSVEKLLWYFYAMFCSQIYFIYLGMLLVALTPSIQFATILASASLTMQNLFSGFLIPQPRIPKWWVWMYWISPVSWTLDGFFTSQYGDIKDEVIAFGEAKSVKSFLREYYGFHPDRLGIVAVVLAVYPLLICFLFAYCIRKLNFQRR
ncbi:pleiotropic drug resistance protein 3-like [Aristolochia californica]|uniref:pleiotropic drug resistance protein 3-like n=1 Tax=Aristolochia californica TaxID=171875 RepID=UPI0035DDF204